jgi:lycopene cyclase domain-containing protein
MVLENYYYLFIHAVAFFPFLLLGFNKRINLWKFRKPALVGISIIGTLFIFWDIYFTHIGIWGFNQTYLIGIDLVGMPLEEILFYLIIPFAFILAFEILQQYIQESSLKNLGRLFLGGVFGFSFLFLFLGFNKIYTGPVVGLALFSSFLFMFLDSKWVGHFALTFILFLIPFLVFKGVLTASILEHKMVWYNENEIVGKRIGNIPVEDLFFVFLLLIWNCQLFEKLKKE